MEAQTFSLLLFSICFQALIYYCEALTQPNLQLQKAACLALRYLKVRDKEYTVVLGFALQKGHLIGTNNKIEIAITAAVVFLFCVAVPHPFSDKGNGLEASKPQTLGLCDLGKV